jgi:hypothetical protein
MGTRVEVVAGLDASDKVIDSPPDWLAQGDHVRIEGGAIAGAAGAKPPVVAAAGVTTP